MFSVVRIYTFFLGFLLCVCHAGRVAALPLLGLENVTYNVSPGSITLDESLFADRASLLRGIDESLKYLRSSAASNAYQRFEAAGISRSLVEQSLERFADILLSGCSPAEVEATVRREFTVFRARGVDGHGSVKFTGYFQPTYQASRVETDQYRYPIFYLPPDFKSWNKPHPKRTDLEGFNGRGGPSTMLFGYELAWLRNRYDAFMIHLQGSAILEFEDRSPVSIGFAAGTNHPFRGISASILKKYNVPWSKLDIFFTQHPSLFDDIISRNNRFIFFQENRQMNPMGSLGIPVVAGRSIATDKLHFPPAAIGFIRTKLPKLLPSGRVVNQDGFRVVLDHDSGSAIKGPGRVDVYLGSGPQAQRLANNLFGMGQLYYLLLKNPQRLASHSSSDQRRVG